MVESLGNNNLDSGQITSDKPEIKPGVWYIYGEPYPKITLSEALEIAKKIEAMKGGEKYVARN